MIHKSGTNLARLLSSLARDRGLSHLMICSGFEKHSGDVTVSRPTVSRWLRGEAIPSDGHMSPLADILDVPPSLLWTARYFDTVDSDPLGKLNRAVSALGEMSTKGVTLAVGLRVAVYCNLLPRTKPIRPSGPSIVVLPDPLTESAPVGPYSDSVAEPVAQCRSGIVHHSRLILWKLAVLNAIQSSVDDRKRTLVWAHSGESLSIGFTSPRFDIETAVRFGGQLIANRDVAFVFGVSASGAGNDSQGSYMLLPEDGEWSILVGALMESLSQPDQDVEGVRLLWDSDRRSETGALQERFEAVPQTITDDFALWFQLNTEK